jgi:hypothetical protein
MAMPEVKRIFTWYPSIQDEVFTKGKYNAVDQN